MNENPKLHQEMSNLLPQEIQARLDNYLVHRTAVDFLAELPSILMSKPSVGSKYNINLVSSSIKLLILICWILDERHHNCKSINTTRINCFKHANSSKHVTFSPSESRQSTRFTRRGFEFALEPSPTPHSWTSSKTWQFLCAVKAVICCSTPLPISCVIQTVTPTTSLTLFFICSCKDTTTKSANRSQGSFWERCCWLIFWFRILLERLIAKKPHPFGLSMIFNELTKNKEYKFWSYDFAHCSPSLENWLKANNYC